MDNKKLIVLIVIIMAFLFLSKKRIYSGKSKSEFIDFLKQYKGISERVGVPFQVMAGQAILESNWGKSHSAKERFNLFGIRCHGYANCDNDYRVYENHADSIADYLHFLRNNPRYQPAFQSDNWEQFLKRIAAAGYATDPNYFEKVKKIIIDNKLNISK